MLRFSLRRKSGKQQPPSSPPLAAPTTQPLNLFPGDEAETIHVNRSSSAWLNFRKRTLSVESVSSLFNGITRGSDNTPRKESGNSTSGGSITGGTTNARLMRTHKMCTKSGNVAELYFGYDGLTIDGRPIPYGDVVYWSHSASHWKLTYMSPTSGKRRELVLYPVDKDKGPLPSDLTEMIEIRIARLVKDQTGCTAERAIRLTTKEASEGDLQQAIRELETKVAPVEKMLGKSPEDDHTGIILEGDEHLPE